MSTISTISTLQKSLSSRQAIAEQDRLVNQARQELVTGLKADVYADRSFRAAQTLDLRNRMDRTEAFATSNRLLQGRLGITSGLVSGVRSSLQSFQALSLSLSLGTQSRDVLQSEARALIKGITSQLNTVYDGEYLFSGQNTQAEPLALPDSLAEAQLPPGASASDAASQIADLDAWFGLNGAPLSTPNYFTSSYGGSDISANARLDEGTTLEFGMNAGDEAVRHMLKGLMMYAQTDVDKLSDPAAFRAWVDEANAALSKGISGLQSHEVILGNQQNFVEDMIGRQENLRGIYNNRVVDIEGVDGYEVASRLEALSAQLEASYAVTVRLKNLSLLNFL
ncbi:flagellin [Pseudogemmobacter faecipullorum]|uniref:Flagellin n=1 Tax=Pseudogemmobacter faecipullorum TaxID=2755041 RepID=A0ABS8CN75_9RHOB|nr:flagellin [Pseudogemmobacter faecipullorum]MCB5410857.1 hypothetical protein [Pseudogemmobacter faecipullorum]